MNLNIVQKNLTLRWQLNSSKLINIDKWYFVGQLHITSSLLKYCQPNKFGYSFQWSNKTSVNPKIKMTTTILWRSSVKDYLDVLSKRQPARQQGQKRSDQIIIKTIINFENYVMNISTFAKFCTDLTSVKCFSDNFFVYIYYVINIHKMWLLFAQCNLFLLWSQTYSLISFPQITIYSSHIYWKLQFIERTQKGQITQIHVARSYYSVHGTFSGRRPIVSLWLFASGVLKAERVLKY